MKSFRYHFTKTRKSYSQNGEDIIIENLAWMLDIKELSYIDVGAYDPFHLSNTARFYYKGCRGVNIEPTEENFNRFMKYRKKDRNLNLAIGSKIGEGVLELNENSAFNRILQKPEGVEKKTIVQVVPLSYVIETYMNKKAPAFLDIDVEGSEIDVLNSMNDYRPRIICIEIKNPLENNLSAVRSEVVEHILTMGYEMYANTGLNGIFYQQRRQTA